MSVDPDLDFSNEAMLAYASRQQQTNEQPAEPEAMSAEEQSERRSGIGGGDIAGLFGLSPWRNPWRIYGEKLGLLKHELPTEWQRWGNLLEPLLISECIRKVGPDRLSVDRGVFVRSKQWPHHIGHLDGDGGWAIVEAKSVGIIGWQRSEEWGEEGTDEVPAGILMQCQWYMGLDARFRVAFVPALVAGRGFLVYEVERDDELIAVMRRRADWFWRKHIVPRIPPRVDGSQDATATLTAMYPRVKRQELLESTPTVDGLAIELRMAREQKVRAEGLEAEVSNQLRAIVGDAAGVQGVWGRARWTNHKRNKRQLRVTFFNDASEEAA